VDAGGRAKAAAPLVLAVRPARISKSRQLVIQSEQPDEELKLFPTTHRGDRGRCQGERARSPLTYSPRSK